MTETLEDFILIEGVDDWVPIFAIDGYAKRLGLTEPAVRYRRIVEVIVRLIRGQLVTVGDLGHENGFMAWPGTIDDLTTRVVNFNFTAAEYDWGVDLWTSNTAAGDRAGAAAAKRLR